MKRDEALQLIMDSLTEKGYFDGPCTYGPNLEENKNNKGKHYVIGFSIPRIVDGCIRLFSTKFIAVTWQYGRRTQNKTFNTVESLIDWFNNFGFNGDYDA